MKKNLFLLIFISIASISFGQINQKKNLFATWELIEKPVDTSKSKINIGSLVLFDEKQDTLEVIKGNPYKFSENFKKRYLKIDKNHVIRYFSGHGKKNKYYIKNDSIIIKDYLNFKILKLNKDSLVLKSNKILKYKKVDINLSDYKLFD